MSITGGGGVVAVGRPRGGRVCRGAPPSDCPPSDCASRTASRREIDRDKEVRAFEIKVRGVKNASILAWIWVTAVFGPSGDRRRELMKHSVIIVDIRASLSIGRAGISDSCVTVRRVAVLERRLPSSGLIREPRRRATKLRASTAPHRGEKTRRG